MGGIHLLFARILAHTHQQKKWLQASDLQQSTKDRLSSASLIGQVPSLILEFLRPFLPSKSCLNKKVCRSRVLKFEHPWVFTKGFISKRLSKRLRYLNDGSRKRGLLLLMTTLRGFILNPYLPRWTSCPITPI